MDITDCMYFALIFGKWMLNVFLLYPPNDFSYVDSFVNQEFFDSLIIIMHDVHLTFLCNNRNVNKN